jgi:hypothetical protein
MEDWKQLNHIHLQALLQIRLSQHENKTSDRSKVFKIIYSLLVGVFNQFLKRQFCALLRCANISPITPVPVPMSKMLNGLFQLVSRRPTKRHQYRRSDLVQQKIV